MWARDAQVVTVIQVGAMVLRLRGWSPRAGDGGLHSHGEVLLQEAAVAKQASPELHADDAKDEEDKEAEQEDIPQHRQCVQEQVHQDPHTWAREGWRDWQTGAEGPERREREQG